ncbi:MAG: hypothetical protein JNL21_15480 [Myxococcales bacterium]|nr:hypothetical protein [Myxococcales bacterium]
MLRREILELAALLGAASAAGCASTPSLVPIGGQDVDPAEIDKDPIALLPSGVLLFGQIDLVALFQTPIGADIGALVQSLVPLGNESNFVPARDTQRSMLGVYAMQGVDFCAVTQGRFDVEAIRRAADARVTTPAGVPFVKSRYGQFDLYTVGNIGFVLLTSKTLLSGNETGMRRALDRLRYNRLSRSVPEWMVELTENKSSSFVVAGDFGAATVTEPASPDKRPPLTVAPTGSAAEPVLEAAAANFPFLSGLRALRLLGNFLAPGLNFAGALTYASNEKAASGAESLRHLAELAQWANLLTSFGFGASIQPAQIAIAEREVAFVQPVDTSIARAFLSMVSGYVRRG